MKSIHQFQLKANNSFKIESIAPIIYFPKSFNDLITLSDVLVKPFYILGEGNNTLFAEERAPIIIKPDFKGITIEEGEKDYVVKAAASENWHELVSYCVNQGVYGLENLALIPGSVGAAPVQNIGAYGVELSNYCTEVTWFEFSSKTFIKLTKSDCKFGYRDSVFKQILQQKGIITEVTMKLPKQWQANLAYAGLNILSSDTSALDVMKKVIALRQSKLPDPHVLPNAGSFFKNPTINNDQFNSLIIQYPNMPFYPQADNTVKLAAGWLIEKVGLKGFQCKGVGVHEKQALVLVNHYSVCGKDIASLALYVQEKVLTKFYVLLEPEVRFVSAKGESKLRVIN